MAVHANNSEGSSVPPEVAQNLEVDDEYNKYTPSADYNSTSGRNIFRNKKFTKKRHESKSRRTDNTQDTITVCGSDEDYPQKSTSGRVRILHGSLPTILLSLNKTIREMTLRDNSASGSGAVAAAPANFGEGPSVTNEVDGNGGGDTGPIGVGWTDPGIGGSAINLEVDEASHQQLMNHCTSNNSSSCNLQGQPQGKRRRHRRKQQYKRMAVDVQSEKKCLQLKVPTSNSSEDSGIGKRKRNIVPGDSNGMCSAVVVARVSVPVPVIPQSVSVSSQSQSTMRLVAEQHVPWGMEADNEDAIMMDCEDMESNTNVLHFNNQGMLATAEESGESDTQNDDLESLSDNNQDADDEESDYYNNDSSTTSLSESSLTILNSSKKFIPVHSREIRSGRRRLKDNYLGTIENEEVSKFIQSPTDTVLKVFPSSEKERLEFMTISSRYSLSFEEGCDQEDQRVWVQFTKTPKTTSTQRKNDLIKAAIGDRFTETSSLAVYLDNCVNEEEECDVISHDCVEGGNSIGVGNNLVRGAACAIQSVNSKRIKKGC